MTWWRLFFLSLVVACFSTGPASAHPEDEFCVGDSGMDPALCRALQNMDRAPDAGARGSGFTETETIDFDRPALETFSLYVKIGVQHILPGGLDHILFVLAMFFSTRRWRPLLIQISAFTVAHTITLGMVAAGVFAPPASIVEPLIAATIAFVAIENLVFKEMTRWRPAIVFGFGLIHGMGFAGFFGSLGLPDDQFWSALIGFNIGVEIGQLAVVALAALLLWPVKQRISEGLYRHAFVWPASGFIGLVGAYWAIERVLSG
ncbi:MAG: HupE/UreJ family protein [Hyphomonadaceae bacterium]|nr:HupE/UreJ family protein [Hyphomonadaceae bacterium]